MSGRVLETASPPTPSFSRVRAVGRRARARRSEEQLAAVRIGDIAPVGSELRMIAGLVAVDHELGAGRQRVAGDAAAQQRIRRSALDHPLLALLTRRELAWLRAVGF